MIPTLYNTVYSRIVGFLPCKLWEVPKFGSVLYLCLLLIMRKYIDSAIPILKDLFGISNVPLHLYNVSSGPKSKTLASPQLSCRLI